MSRRILLAGIALLLSACSAEPSASPKPPCPTEPPTSVSAQASLQGVEVATVTVSGAVEGSFEIELLAYAAPIAAANFVNLVRCGFYDGVTFHRVVAGFVIQAGDPGTRDNRGDFPALGTGGPGYGFEIEPPAEGLRYDRYVVAMANNRVANGSQFFIDLVDLDDALRRAGVYTIFGRVTTGTEVVDSIGAVPVNNPEMNLPLTPVVIETITLSAAPEASPSG